MEMPDFLKEYFEKLSAEQKSQVYTWLSRLVINSADWQEVIKIFAKH
jgi:hypothetical protein